MNFKRRNTEDRGKESNHTPNIAVAIEFPAPSDESSNPFLLLFPVTQWSLVCSCYQTDKLYRLFCKALSALPTNSCTSQFTQKTTLERFGKLLTVISFIGLIVLTLDRGNRVFSCTERQLVRRTSILALSFSRKVWLCGGNFIYAVCRSEDVRKKSRFQDSKNLDEFLNGSATHIVNSTTFSSTKLTFCEVKTLTEWLHECLNALSQTSIDCGGEKGRKHGQTVPRSRWVNWMDGIF